MNHGLDTQLPVLSFAFESTPNERATVSRCLYGGYHAVGGLQWPFREARLLNGVNLRRIEIQSVKLNFGIADREFERPTSPVR